MASLIASAVIDMIADRRARQRHDQWAREAAADRIRLTSYRRPVAFGQPLDQNAADWYHQAFSRSIEPSPEQLTQLHALVDAGLGQEASLPHDLEAVCFEANAARIAQALQCTRCDWKLDYGMGASSLFDPNARAVAVADCLTLAGHRAAGAQRWDSAANAYLKVTAYGCDLGAGNLIMNIVGIGAAKTGLGALARLLTTVDYHPVLFRDVANRLTGLQSCLPTLRNGIQLDRLQFTNAIIVEALTANSRTSGWIHFLPRHALTAWRLTRDLELVNGVAQGAAIADREERARFISELQQRSTTSNPLVKEYLVASGLGAVDEANDLVRDAHAVLAVIEIEQWHAREGRYPAGPSQVPSLLHEDRVRYERAADGSGYSLFGTSVAGKPQTLAQRSRRDRPLSPVR